MSDQSHKFKVILLGSDFNVYGMARSLYNTYHQPIDAYAQVQYAPTQHTKIVRVHTINGFAKDPVWIKTMLKLKARYAHCKYPVILIGCSDGYAQLISKHKSQLDDVFVCPYVDYKTLKKLINKENFYKVAQKYGLPHPTTKIITRKDWQNHQIDKIIQAKPVFKYPCELKPADSVEWLDIHFQGRRKTFTVKSEHDLKHYINEIYGHGYHADLIYQDFIPGDDSNMRVLNAYVDKNSNVKMMCLGHPLLEDCSPSAIGNYVAILPEYDHKIYQQIQHFLEAIHYTGYANFDIKFDHRDNTYKVFEINLRQGRSSFYVTLNGYNLANWVVRDYVFDDLKHQPTVYGNKNLEDYKLWLGVGINVFKKYAKNNQDKQTALKLIRNGDYGHTYWYSKDKNLMRYLQYKWTDHNYTKNFAQYFKLTKE